MSFVLFPGLSTSECCCTSASCSLTLLPRSQRTTLIQSTIESIQAIFALGQQNLPRSNESIFLTAIQLNPTEPITQQNINQALGAGLSTGLFCLADCGYWSVNPFMAKTKRSLKIYYPFIIEYNPCRVRYPPINLTPQ